MSDMKDSEVVKLAVLDEPAGPDPIPAEDLVAGDPQATITILWRNPEGTLLNGVWHCTPGSFYLNHPDETVVFIEGRATVTPVGGQSVELTAGDVGFFPNGTRVLWEVHETVRKGFHSHYPDGQPAADASS